MAAATFAPVLRYLRHIAKSGDAPTDGELLERFVRDGSEADFAALVRRHQGMVHAVCRRVLGNSHDADDACQAAFLVLLGQAKKIVSRNSVASWLHGVGYRTALKARTAARRRRQCERQVPPRDASDGPYAADRAELRSLLDEEVARLPEKYRLPFVLCYLEGKTHAEAAGQLRWPAGTVATRVAQARARLRLRLRRRGAWPAAGVLVVATVSDAAGPPANTGACSEQAIHLAQGVLRTMKMTKVRNVVVAALAVAGLVAVGLGIVLRATAAEAGNAAVPVGPGSVFRAGAVKGPDDRGGKGPLAPQPRVFQVECQLEEIEPGGARSVLSRPRVAAPDGQTSRCMVGQAWPVPGKQAGTLEYVDIGNLIDVTVTDQLDGRLRLEIVVQVSEATTVAGENDVQVSGQTVRRVTVVRPGETVRCNFGGGRYLATFTVK
jgi:RNA polymerase sigma factor (sigma-70 family)